MYGSPTFDIHPSFGTTYLFLLLLKSATSNSVHNFGSESKMPKTTVPLINRGVQNPQLSLLSAPVNDVIKWGFYSRLNVTAICYNVTCVQYRQQGGMILLNRTADLIVVLMKLLKWYSRYPFRRRNTFCWTRSLSNATFSFLIMWCSSSSKSAAVYKI